MQVGGDVQVVFDSRPAANAAGDSPVARRACKTGSQSNHDGAATLTAFHLATGLVRRTAVLTQERELATRQGEAALKAGLARETEAFLARIDRPDVATKMAAFLGRERAHV